MGVSVYGAQASTALTVKCLSASPPARTSGGWHRLAHTPCGLNWLPIYAEYVTFPCPLCGRFRRHHVQPQCEVPVMIGVRYCLMVRVFYSWLNVVLSPLQPLTT